MIKNNKGITLVSLIITIALMAIISTTTVTVSMDRFEINKFNKMKTDIELLLDKVSNYYLKYGVLPILRNGTNNTSITYPKRELDFVNQDTTTQYYILDLEAMEGISLNYGKSGFNYWKNYAQNINNDDEEAKKDIYIISSDTHNVYYVKGMKLKDRVYHYAKANNGLEDTIPPSTPQIKLVSGIQNNKGIYTTEVELEIVPGKEDGNVAKKTEISTDNGGTWTNINRLANNIYKITSTGEHLVQVRSYDKNDNISENSMELSLEIRERKKLTAYSENKSWLELPRSLDGTVSKFRIYGNSEEVQQLLPSQYQQVEYIESTGTQYIDTKLKPTNLTKVEIEFMYSELDGFVYGSRTSASSDDAHSFIINIGSAVYPQFNGQQSNVGSSYNKTNTKYNLVNSQDGAYINNELIKSYTQSNFTSSYSIYLFALNQGNNLESRTFKGRIYGCKIWDNGRIVRNMIPCYRKLDNVMGMYDLINGVFYTNAGTGTFLKGTNIADTPTPEVPKEIQSVGDLVTDTTDVNYGKYKIPVKTSGKNLFDRKIEIGRIDPNTGEDSSFGYQEYYRSINFIEIDSSIENIVFSSDTNARRIHLCCYDENYNYLGNRYHNLNIDGDRTFYSISLLNDTKYIRFSITTYNNPAIIENVPIQVEYGDIKTEYEPYVENITNIYLNEPLRKVGDYADYIDFGNKKVVRNVSYYEFKGTETISIPTSVINGYTPFRFLDFSNIARQPFVCNYLPFLAKDYGYANGECIAKYSTGGQMFFVISNDRIPFNDTVAFKSWLEKLYSNGAPLTVYYPLVTPKEETIELPELTTFNEYTKIEVLTEVTPSKIEAEYDGYDFK